MSHRHGKGQAVLGAIVATNGGTQRIRGSKSTTGCATLGKSLHLYQRSSHQPSVREPNDYSDWIAQLSNQVIEWVALPPSARFGGKFFHFSVPVSVKRRIEYL